MKEIRKVISTFCEQELPKMCVDDEHETIDFDLLPGVESNLSKVLTNLNDSMNELSINGFSLPAPYGDAVAAQDCFARLMRGENGNGDRSERCVSDEIVNMMTNLYCCMNKRRAVFLFNSLTMKTFHALYSMSEGVNETDKTEEKKAFIRGQKRQRTGQLLTFHDAEFICAPCHVSSNH